MLPYSDTLAALINGRPVTWDSLGTEPAPWLEACAAEGVSALVYRSVKRFPSGYAWPERVVEGLARAGPAGVPARVCGAGTGGGGPGWRAARGTPRGDRAGGELSRDAGLAGRVRHSAARA